jgi:hypothetical protein
MKSLWIHVEIPHEKEFIEKIGLSLLGRELNESNH